MEPSLDRSVDDGDRAPLFGSRIVLVIRDRPRPFPGLVTPPFASWHRER